jgi:hypothetical protein
MKDTRLSCAFVTLFRSGLYAFSLVGDHDLAGENWRLLKPISGG